MGLFTLGTIISESTALLGNNLQISQSRASLYANKAHLFIWDTAQLHDQSEALAVSSTTSGGNRITLPTDFQEIVTISNISNTPPYPLQQWQIDDIDSSYTYQGRPTNFVRYNTWLELWPSPDSSYSLQIRYRNRPSTLTSLTASASFSTRYEMAWLYKTTEYLADSVRDYEAASLMRSKFLGEMMTQPSDLGLRQRTREGMRVSIPHFPRGEQRIDSLTSVI